jgi:hypothetical protein
MEVNASFPFQCLFVVSNTSIVANNIINNKINNNKINTE